MVTRRQFQAVFLAMMLSAAPAMAESLRLEVESGAITGITDKDSGMLVLYITEQSGRDLANFTQRYVGKTLDVFIGDTLMASPVIHSPIFGPEIPITLPMSDTERRETIVKLIDGATALELRTNGQ